METKVSRTNSNEENDERSSESDVISCYEDYAELCDQWGMDDRYISHKVWNQFQRSDEICRALRGLTFTDFDGIVWITDVTESAEDAVAWFRMLNRVRAKFPETKRSRTNSLLREMQEKCTNPSSEFYSASIDTGNLAIDKNPEAAWFFIYLYGEHRTIEVLNSLETLDPNISLASIYSLFERWDEFKDYPISWTLNLLEAERNSTAKIEELAQWKY